MSAHEEVRRASERFYAALNRMANGDAGLMPGAWSHGPEVTAMHPIDGREIGWDAVKASFDQFAQVATDGNVDLKDQIIRVEGTWRMNSVSSRVKHTLADILYPTSTGSPISTDARLGVGG